MSVAKPPTSRPLPESAPLLRVLEYASARMSRYGERHGIDWLVYNPVQMWTYHRLASADAAPLADAVIATFPRCRSIIDVGAGSGALAAEFKRRGERVWAYERSRGGRVISRMQGVPSKRFDLRRETPLRLSAPADVACCFEVAEHLPEHLGERLVDVLASVAPVVIFSAASPGQGGLGHVNERNPGYWIERFGRAGARHDPAASMRIRETFAQAGGQAPWFQTNIHVFLAAGSR
ncbi:MAG: class I SAM-dependent methyltransferase [Actinomycetota bacterium]|nr:class I SAM-dependent methyltransferase [Actinomycetota bacterium]